MNRIDRTFRTLRSDKKKALIPYLTAGFPNLGKTEQLVLAFEKAGADIIELGVPFSDPLADGPTIQESSAYALKKGVTLKKILQLVQRLRMKTDIPLCLMTYYNPVFHYGEEQFVAHAKKAGVDGLIIPDLPPEEAQRLMKAAKRSGIAIIFFLSPTTQLSRMKMITRKSTGFIYYVSVAGVTGARVALPKNLLKNIHLAKKQTAKPVCVGFGVSTPTQAKKISRSADGVIVGSAIIKMIKENMRSKHMVVQVARFVQTLARGVKA